MGIKFNRKQIKFFLIRLLLRGKCGASAGGHLQKLYTLEEYIELQTEQLFLGISGMSQVQKKGSMTK